MSMNARHDSNLKKARDKHTLYKSCGFKSRILPVDFSDKKILLLENYNE